MADQLNFSNYTLILCTHKVAHFLWGLGLSRRTPLSWGWCWKYQQSAVGAINIWWPSWWRRSRGRLLFRGQAWAHLIWVTLEMSHIEEESSLSMGRSRNMDIMELSHHLFFGICGQNSLLFCGSWPLRNLQGNCSTFWVFHNIFRIIHDDSFSRQPGRSSVLHLFYHY